MTADSAVTATTNHRSVSRLYRTALSSDTFLEESLLQSVQWRFVSSGRGRGSEELCL